MRPGAILHFSRPKVIFVSCETGAALFARRRGLQWSACFLHQFASGVPRLFDRLRSQESWAASRARTGRVR